MPIIPAAESVTHDMHGARFSSLANPSCGTQESSLWRVSIPAGTPGTRHAVTREEIFVVTAGEAEVQLGEVTGRAVAGDVIVVPPDTDFLLQAQGDGPFEALVCLPVGGRARLPDGTVFVPPWAR